MALPQNLLPKLYRHLLYTHCLESMGKADFHGVTEELISVYPDWTYGEGTASEIREIAATCSEVATNMAEGFRRVEPQMWSAVEASVLRINAETLSARSGLSFTDAAHALNTVIVMVRCGF